MTADSGSWASTDLVRNTLERAHRRGYLLRESVGVPGRVDGSGLFPLRISLPRPSRLDVADNLQAVTSWARDITRTAAAQGWRVEARKVSGSTTVGPQMLPWFAHVDDLSTAVKTLGRPAAAEVEEYQQAEAAARQHGTWATQVAHARPWDVLAAGADWPALLATAAWLINHPRPGIPARLLPVEGVHTKVIERNTRLLSRLLDAGLDPASVDQQADTFAARYGLAEPVKSVTLRTTGAAVGLPHLPAATVTWPMDGLAGWDPVTAGVRQLVIVENLHALDTVPVAPDRVTVWGSGDAAAGLVAQLAWAASCDVRYFGDIDSHGMAIVDAVRAVLPTVTTICMDTATVEQHRQHVTVEPAADVTVKGRLTPDEVAALAATGPQGRLEQERIPRDWIARYLP